MPLFLVLALILPGLASASVLGAYEAEVEVLDRDEASRAAAIRTALAQLLFRLSGTPGLQSDPSVRSALARPERLVRSFAYVDGAVARTGDPEARLALRVSFAPEEVLRLLDETRAPVWFGPRPEVLVLLQADMGTEEPSLIREVHPLAPALQRAARTLHYSLVFPLGDVVEDRAILEALARGDGMGPFAARYGVRVVLGGRIQVAGVASAECLFWQADRSARQSFYPVAEEALADALIDALHRWLAARYAAPAAERGREVFPLAISGLRAASDYLALMALLRNHGLFASVRPEQAEGDRLQLTVEARIQRWRAIDVLRLDPRLEPDPRPRAGMPSELQLVWLP